MILSSGSRRPEVFCKKDVIKNFPKFTGKHVCWSLSFLIKLQSETCNFIKKETPTHVFSSEFSEMFKNFFFKEHLRVNASANDFNLFFRLNVIALQFFAVYK